MNCSNTNLSLALGADVVIAVFGGVLGREGVDRTNISLPSSQATMLDTLVAQVLHGKAQVRSLRALISRCGTLLHGVAPPLRVCLAAVESLVYGPV